MSKLSFMLLTSLTISSTHKVSYGGFCTNILLFEVQATPMCPFQSALSSTLQRHPMLTVSRIRHYVVVNLEYFVRLDYCGAYQCNSAVFLELLNIIYRKHSLGIDWRLLCFLARCKSPICYHEYCSELLTRHGGFCWLLESLFTNLREDLLLVSSFQQASMVPCAALFKSLFHSH